MPIVKDAPPVFVDVLPIEVGVEVAGELVISIRTSPAGARRPSPLTVSMPNGPCPSSRPATFMSPLVVVSWSADSVAARSSMSPDTERAMTWASPVAWISMSPDTASIAIRPATARRATSPDAVR